MLGIVKRNFIYLTPGSFVILYKSSATASQWSKLLVDRLGKYETTGAAWRLIYSHATTQHTKRSRDAYDFALYKFTVTLTRDIRIYQRRSRRID